MGKGEEREIAGLFLPACVPGGIKDSGRGAACSGLLLPFTFRMLGSHMCTEFFYSLRGDPFGK